MGANLPANERERLAEIERMSIMRNAADPNLQALVDMLAATMRVPICAISIIQANEQVFLAAKGLDVCSTDRKVSFCTHLLDQPEGLLLVPDATADARFAENALVKGGLGIRAYAGAPIVGDGGLVLGAVCAVDTKTRKFTHDQLFALKTVANEVSARLNLTHQLLSLDQTKSALRESEVQRQASDQHLSALLQNTEIGCWEVRMPDFQLTLDDSYLAILGYRPGEFEMTYAHWQTLLHPEDTAEFEQRFAEHYTGQKSFAEAEFRLKHREGHYVWCNARGSVMEVDAEGSPTLLMGIMQDCSSSKAMHDSLLASENRLRTAQTIAKVGSWEFDLSNQEIWWSAETFRIFEIDPAEGCPSFERLLELHHPDDRHELAEAVKRAATTGEVYELNLRVEVNGQTKHLVAVGEAIRNHEDQVYKLVGVVQDVSIHRELEKSTKSREAYLNMITTAIPDVLFTYSLSEEQTLFTNRDFATFLGYSRDQLSGAEALRTFAHPTDFAQLEERMAQLSNMPEDTALDSEVRLLHADGNWRMVLMRMKVFERSSAGQIQSLIVLGRDVTLQHSLEEVAAERLVRSQLVHEELKKREQELLRAKVELENRQLQLATTNLQLEEQAMTDGLTGIANHRAFRERLKEMTAQYLGTGVAFSIVILDLDRFKEYNDSYGHPVGDQALKLAAQVLQETIRPEDFVARYGGEEFVLLLPDSGDVASRTVMQRIQRRAAQVSWPHREVTFSLGACTAAPGLAQGDELLRLADQALYVSKERGRNQAHHWLDIEGRQAA